MLNLKINQNNKEEYFFFLSDEKRFSLMFFNPGYADCIPWFFLSVKTERFHESVVLNSYVIEINSDTIFRYFLNDEILFFTLEILHCERIVSFLEHPNDTECGTIIEN